MTTPARVLGFLLATVVTFASGSAAAWADAPVGSAWPDAQGRGTLGTLVFFGGCTVGLYILVALFGLLTARNNFTPAAPGKEIHTVGDQTPVKH